MSQTPEQIINDLVITFIFFYENKSPSENIIMDGNVQFNFCFPLRFNVMKYKNNSGFFIRWQTYKDSTGEYKEVVRWNAVIHKELVAARKKEIEEQILEEFLRKYPKYSEAINNSVQIIRGSVDKKKEESVPLISIQTPSHDDSIPFNTEDDDDELFQRMLSQNED